MFICISYSTVFPDSRMYLCICTSVQIICTIIQTYKAWWVVIFYSFGIAERLEDWVGLQELPFQLALWGNTQGEESHQPSNISHGRHLPWINWRRISLGLQETMRLNECSWNLAQAEQMCRPSTLTAQCDFCQRNSTRWWSQTKRLDGTCETAKACSMWTVWHALKGMDSVESI